MSLILSFKVGKCYVGNRTAKDVLRCLADYADDNGEKCFPGRETIVKETEINKNSFAAAIGFLESNGWIKINRHQKANSNSYELNVAKIFSESQATENQTVVPKSGQPKTSTTVVPKTGRPKNGSTQNPYNCCPKTSTTVVPKSGQDPVMIQSINSHIHNRSSEQNSDDLQSGSNIETSEEFTLTPPEENESPEQEETKELTPKQRSIQIGKRCPQEKLVELYHERLPGLPTVRSWNTATRKQNMAARWREMSQRQEFQSEQEGLDFFRSFFDFVGRSPFLMGQVQTNNSNSRPWRADLPWLMKAENFAKVIDRKYHG